MNQTYGQESETERIRGTESQQNIRVDTYGGENAERASEGTGSQRISLNRKGSEEGNFLGHAVGGMLDQLIDDAEKQLVKSRECIVWYGEEVKEYEQKLNNFRRLKELHQQQMAAEAAKVAEAAESFDQNGGANLAE